MSKLAPTRRAIGAPPLPRGARVCAVALVPVLLLAAGARAESPAPEALDATPRAAMKAYLEAARAGEWEDAAAFLDLRALPPARRAAAGPDLARKLKSALDRALWVDLDALSAEPEGDRDDGLAPRLESVGALAAGAQSVDVLLERRPRADGEPGWRIAPQTVAAIPTLDDWFGESPWISSLPEPLRERGPFEVRVWQWLALAALVPLALVLAWTGAWALQRAARALARRAAPGFDEDLLRALAGPLRVVGVAVLLAPATAALGLAVPAARAIRGIELAVGLVGAAWLLLRLVDVGAGEVERRLRARARSGALAVIPLVRRALKAALAVLAGIALLQNLGFDATGLLAGVGVGGLAIALAAQKTVENLFGGVTLVTDQPVRVGDFCRFGGRVGTVEDVGLRSTRVRTLDRTLVTVPNAQFASFELENFGARDRIWLQATLGLRYETSADQLRQVLARVKQLLQDDPRVDPDPARVRLAGFGASSLDLEIFAYLRTRDINEFYAIREELFLRMMDVLAECGTGFAFPSRTVYAAKDEGLDPERKRAAEERGRALRSADPPGAA
jgi:MscS family membrane protein